jgi:hypothetical protein
MNGWHRLWVVGSVVSAAATAVVTGFQISDVQPTISESTLKYFESEVPTPISSGKPTFHPDRPYYAVEEKKVITPSHYQREMEVAATREAVDIKHKIAVVALVVWALGCGGMLGVGHGIAWIIRGFRKQNA